mmetsp:Transcript_54019/g.142220  ORF Transcript_54019/g.142220 Transcript_54019/m.142220 type:complete len:231 (+) Transcript_54019:104-796(+)
MQVPVSTTGAASRLSCSSPTSIEGLQIVRRRSKIDLFVWVPPIDGFAQAFGIDDEHGDLRAQGSEVRSELSNVPEVVHVTIRSDEHEADEIPPQDVLQRSITRPDVKVDLVPQIDMVEPVILAFRIARAHSLHKLMLLRISPFALSRSCCSTTILIMEQPHPIVGVVDVERRVVAPHGNLAKLALPRLYGFLAALLRAPILRGVKDAYSTSCRKLLARAIILLAGIVAVS